MRVCHAIPVSVGTEGTSQACQGAFVEGAFVPLGHYPPLFQIGRKTLLTAAMGAGEDDMEKEVTECTEFTQVLMSTTVLVCRVFPMTEIRQGSQRPVAPHRWPYGQGSFL